MFLLCVKQNILSIVHNFAREKTCAGGFISAQAKSQIRAGRVFLPERKNQNCITVLALF